MQTPMSDSPRQYPVACPICREDKGFPVKVRTLTERPGHIEVKVRCRDCNHEWVEISSSRD